MRQTYERRAGPDSHDVPIINGEKPVDIARAVAGEISTPMGSGGIELDTVARLSKDEAEAERFMRDPIEVHLHDPATEDEPQFAEITVNGIYKLLRRGEIATVPRAHVAVLAQAKTERLVQTKIVNPDGSMGYRERMVMRLMYPFSIINDPNPKGPAWIRELLKNPA